MCVCLFRMCVHQLHIDLRIKSFFSTIVNALYMDVTLLLVSSRRISLYNWKLWKESVFNSTLTFLSLSFYFPLYLFFPIALTLALFIVLAAYRKRRSKQRKYCPCRVFGWNQVTRCNWCSQNPTKCNKKGGSA